jgi:ribosomal protein S18 acetylase RimI-like enzyme
MVEFTLRAAKKSDAGDLAILDNLAGHGISLWFWKDALGSARTDHAFALGRSRLAEPTAFYGWKSTMVAIDHDDCVLGSASSYIMPEPDEEADDIKANAKAFIPVFELFEAVAGAWFIDSLAVFPEFQKNGIASSLVDESLARARQLDVQNAALVSEDSNTNANRLYESRGFSVSDTRSFIEFDGPSDTKKWQLMTCELEG